ncbi:hypothetical protein ACJ5NV_16825 [Loktanella agnita]|uniref:hypothetical protein n=1 Tax=Loktanella agnita TaxID=287097 RepID=UPI0039894FDD
MGGIKVHGDRISQKDQALTQILQGSSGFSIEYLKTKVEQRKDPNFDGSDWSDWVTYIHELIDKGELFLNEEMQIMMGDNFGGK